MAPIDRLSIRVTKTANGQHEYVQIMIGGCDERLDRLAREGVR